MTRIGAKIFLKMNNKYIIDYLREMTESLESINSILKQLSGAVSVLPDKEKEEANADDKQDTKKRGRKKKSAENDGGPGVEDKPV